MDGAINGMRSSMSWHYVLGRGATPSAIGGFPDDAYLFKQRPSKIGLSAASRQLRLHQHSLRGHFDMTNSTSTDKPLTPANDERDSLFVHHAPKDARDRFALGFTKLLRFFADTFFAKRYGHRAIVLETVAAVPGMVGAMLTHFRCLRRMIDDEGWIRTLLEEAENGRMHLMTFIEIAKPTWFERVMILLVQWFFFVGFFFLYLLSARTAHRVVGYFEEEAVISYTAYLKDIDEGRSPNVPAPAIAKHYWKLADNATLRDVVLVVRADEAHHRDVNHGVPFDHAAVAPYPKHAETLRAEER
jgi:ubiquinol oxidase